MKTRPFDASKYKPGDKLVCGGDPVTELIVGNAGYVGGVCTDKFGNRLIFRWTSTGGKNIDSPNSGRPLEVLIPEPEHPACGYVPLDNGVPVWSAADPSEEYAQEECRAQQYTGPVVPCYIARPPMTREEARSICQQQFGDRAYPKEAVEVALETSQWHVRAEGE